MGKQHDTFPGEQPEMPVPKETPEVNQPSDPRQPEVPQENPDNLLQELPPIENPQKGMPLKQI
jgi:hypothetical protein